MHRPLVLVVIILLSLITACSPGDDTAPVNDASTQPPQLPTPSPTRGLTQLRDIEVQYTLLNESQSELETLWQDLSNGESVSCAEVVTVPVASSAITGQSEVEELLFQAATNLESSAEEWAVECGNPRPLPPGDVINRGLTAALSAKDYLNQAETLLNLQNSE